MKGYNRRVHIVSALTVFVVAALVLYALPDLRKDAGAWFGTVSGFVTFYGLVFTIIEVLYTKGAAEQAEKEARAAAKAARGVYELRDISECLSGIENILDQLNNKESASLTLISRVVKMYSSQFAHQIDNDTSTFRINLDTVEAYTFAVRPRGGNKHDADLRKALINMTSQLAAMSAKKSEQ